MLTCWSGLVFGQKERDLIRGINEYVDFTNESIHGMLIAHRLFENYNQDLNLYVDLPGHTLNFYKNSDLPADIFEDPDGWFYEVSPSRLFANTISNKYKLQTKYYSDLQKIGGEIRHTTLMANQLRLSIADSINHLDLNNQDNLYGIYEQLEQAVDAFDLLQAQVLILEDLSKKILDTELPNNGNTKFKKLIQILNDIDQHAKDLVLAIKREDVPALKVSLSELESVDKRLRAYSILDEGGFASTTYVLSRNRIISNISELIRNTKSYLNEEPIPSEYELYGPSYYYFNTMIVNKINRYGNGMVSAMNDMIDQLRLPLTHKLEIPHYLVVLYPNKVEKQIPVIQSSLDEIDEAPLTLENRTIVMSDKKHQILVDEPNPTLEIFDYRKQDGDIISLNFNGDWIYQNLSLERKPRKFILKLNEKGKNFLILHAINEGSIPPNTIGINYIHEGRKKRYIMSSNLRTSQMVEIKLDK